MDPSCPKLPQMSYVILFAFYILIYIKFLQTLRFFLFNFIVHTEQAGRSYKGQEKLKKKRLIKLSYRQALLKKEILKLDLKQKNIY